MFGGGGSADVAVDHDSSYEGGAFSVLDSGEV